jgi:hypothetical protein
MRKSIVALGAVFAAMSFASLSPLMAADEPVKQEKPAAEFTFVRGTIKTVDLKTKTLTVEVKGGEVKTVVYTDKTEIVKNKAAYTEALKVGDVITAKIKDNAAVRIELRVEKPRKNAEVK